MGEVDDFLYRIDGADCIRGVSDRDQFGVLVDLAARSAMSRVQSSSWISTQRTVTPAIFAMSEPGRDVGVVVEAGEQDLVSGLEFAANGAADGEGQRGHVRAEDDFVSAAVQEVGHGAAGSGDHRVGAAAGGVGSAGVGVVVAQVVGDGVDHALRDLRSAGAVEEGGGVSVDGLGQGGNWERT